MTPGWGAPSSPGSPGAGVLWGIHGPCQVPLVPARSPGAPWHRVAPPGSALLLPRSAAAAWPGLDAPRGHGDHWVWAGGHGWSSDRPCQACNYSPAGGIAHETRARWGAGRRGASVCRHGCQSWPRSSWEGCGESGPRPPQALTPVPILGSLYRTMEGGDRGDPRGPQLTGQPPDPALSPFFPPPGASYGVLPRPCRALVLLNPQSGAGRALDDFHAVVQPMLADADIAPSIFITGESPARPDPSPRPPPTHGPTGGRHGARSSALAAFPRRETPPRAGEDAGGGPVAVGHAGGDVRGRAAPRGERGRMGHGAGRRGGPGAGAEF